MDSERHERLAADDRLARACVRPLRGATCVALLVGLAAALTPAAACAQDLAAVPFDDGGYRAARQLLAAEGLDSADLALALATLEPRIAEGTPKPGQFHGLWIAGLVLERSVRALGATDDPAERERLTEVARGCLRLFARGQQWTWIMSPKYGAALLTALERVGAGERVDECLTEWSTLLPAHEAGRGFVERRRIERAYRAGDWASAEALWRAEEAHVRWRVVFRLLRLGLAGSWSPVLRTAQRTAGLDAELVEHVQSVANHDVLRARMDLTLGLPDAALVATRRAASALAELGIERPKTKARVALLEADIALAVGDSAGAFAALARLLGEGEAAPRDKAATGPPSDKDDIRPEALLRRGLAHTMAGDEGRALADYAAALEAPGATDDVRTTARLRRAERAVLQGDLALAHADLKELRADAARMGVLERGHTLALEARRAALAGEAPDELLRRELDAVCQQLFVEWGARPLRPGGFGLLRYARTSLILGATAAAHVDANEPEAALALVLQAHAVGTLARASGAAPVDLGDVRRALTRKGAGVLVFLPSPWHSFTFLVGTDRLHVHRGPRQKDLNEHSRAHREALWSFDAAAGDTRRAAREAALESEGRRLVLELLGEELVAQLAELDTLAIVGRDLVEGVALEALDVGGRPLGIVLATYDVPSLPLAVAAAEAPIAAPRVDTRVVVDTASRRAVADDGPPLPLGRSEIDAWVRPFRRGEVDFDGAPLGAAGLAELDEVGVLVLLAHGRRGDRGTPELALGASLEERFTVATIEALRGVPACVVLAACRSGRGPQRRGDAGSADLGGAFLARGSRAALVTDDDVPLGPVVALVERFQREVARGSSPAQALLVARRALYAAGGDGGRLALVLARAIGAADVPLPLEARHGAGGRDALVVLSGVALAALAATTVRRRRSGPAALR